MEGVLRVIGITTIGLHLGEELNVSSKQLLDIFRDFKDSVASAPQLHEVQACWLDTHDTSILISTVS